MTHFKSLLGGAVGGVLFLTANLSWGHEIRPAIAELSFDGRGGYDVAISLNLEALIAEIEPEHDNTAESVNAPEYDRLRLLGPDALGIAFAGFEQRFLSGIALMAGDDPLQPAVKAISIPAVGDPELARNSEIMLTGTLPEGAQTVTWSWDARWGASIVRVRGAQDGGAVVYSEYLENGATSEPIAVVGVTEQSTPALFADYVMVGFTHIVPKGLDHILFVIGLFLLNTQWRSLIVQITSFTIAHSVTLALGMLEIVQLPASIVEPLIAASIVYVAIENIVSDKLQAWRPLVVFGFGLLHGLGFAGVLAEVGLQSAHFVTGLIAFNVGVELGQLAVVAGCFLAVGLFRHAAWYRAAVTIPASLAIAAIGAWWFVERTI